MLAVWLTPAEKELKARTGRWRCSGTVEHERCRRTLHEVEKRKKNKIEEAKSDVNIVFGGERQQVGSPLQT